MVSVLFVFLCKEYLFDKNTLNDAASLHSIMTDGKNLLLFFSIDRTIRISLEWWQWEKISMLIASDVRLVIVIEKPHLRSSHL